MKTNEILPEECILEVGKVQVEIHDSFSKEERYLEIVKYEIRDNKAYLEMECEFEGLLLFATFSRGKVCDIESLSLIEQWNCYLPLLYFVQVKFFFFWFAMIRVIFSVNYLGDFKDLGNENISFKIQTWGEERIINTNLGDFKKY